MLAKIVSRVLAACLCVPLPGQHPEFDKFNKTDRSPAENMARLLLAMLLAFTKPPTRLACLRSDFRRMWLSSTSLLSMKRLFSTHHHMERLIVECDRIYDVQVRT